jgi:hypothetical protein
MATTQESLQLDKRSFYNKISRTYLPTRFISVIIFFNRPFKDGNGGLFKLLRWMQNLHQSTWEHNISMGVTAHGPHCTPHTWLQGACG